MMQLHEKPTRCFTIYNQLVFVSAGVPKHHILNANLFRNGADYAVFINTAQEFDGSDSGAHL